MKDIIKTLFKLLLKVLIVTAIIGVVCLLVWHFFGLALTKAFLYLGIACILIGVLSASGSTSMYRNAGSSYVQTSTLNHKSSENMVKDFLKARDSSVGFLLFMAAVGGALIGISYLLRTLGI